MGLGASDWITLFGILASTVVSIVSVAIAVLTLQQNSKMLQENTRPYITIYFTVTYVDSACGYFVIENFGQTGAQITRFAYDPVLKKSRHKEIKQLEEQFDRVEGMYLAPHQKQIFTYVPETVPINPCDFLIDYTDGIKTYHNDCSINISAFDTAIKLRKPSDKEVKALDVIARCGQEIVERLV